MKKFSVVISLLFTTAFFYCNKDNPTSPKEVETALKVISSDSNGRLTTPSGVGIEVIAGTVPPNQQGQSAEVTFSIETPVQSPGEFPTGAKQSGSISKFGPEAFIFKWPVRILLPFPEKSDPSAFNILQYDPIQESWRVIPASLVDFTNKIIGADVLELSYNALATVTSWPAKASSTNDDESIWGGFEFTNLGSEWYYTLTVKSVSNFAVEWQAVYANQLIGQTGSTGTDGMGSPLPFTHILLPQASYEIWISSTTGKLPYTVYTYSVPATGRVQGHVVYDVTSPFGRGWTPLGLPAGGQWIEGMPELWPDVTTTYGTGQFQATLNWTNNNMHTTDLDLHLYGPNEMHVYFADDVSPDSSIMLDRDWISEQGAATENIYSIKPMPKGQYTVKVNRYSGDGTNFRVRIVRSGSVKTHTKSVTASNEEELTIETFKVQ